MKSLRDYAQELNVAPITLSRWISGQRKVPNQFKAVLPLIVQDLKPHKSNKIGYNNLVTNENHTDLASNCAPAKRLPDESWVRSSNLLPSAN